MKKRIILGILLVWSIVYLSACGTVTYEELLYVDGIGETYARKIINYRETHGGFKKVIELKSLLGTKAYESVMENFYVD